jgi:hypothetical protein
MAAHPVNEEAIFKVACSITDPEARTVYLKQICGGDQSLFDRVAALLKVRDDEPDFLESPPSGLAGTLKLPEMHERLGEQIGPYKLLQIIGEGQASTPIFSPVAETRQVI